MAGGAGALWLSIAGPAGAAAGNAYPEMAPLGQYRGPGGAEEAALARSAAPPSIAGEAQVLVLGARGYETAAAGHNGFVCLVERSWANEFDDAEFWNPKIRGPICYNAAAARSVLPAYLKRTEWLLAGAGKAELLSRTKAAVAAKEITTPEAGAMSYMLSKGGYLGDVAGGHWQPHLMFFLPPTESAAWGANQAGSPVMGGGTGVEPVSVFFVPVAKWSDGTPGPAQMAMPN
jgi:hypothetical protein